MSGTDAIARREAEGSLATASGDGSTTELDVATDRSVAPHPRPARTWQVSLAPDEVVAALRRASGIARLALAHGRPRGYDHSSAKVFMDDTGNSPVLWTSARATRRHDIERRFGHVTIPEFDAFQEVMRLTIEPSLAGSRIVATWESHPHAKAHARDLVIGAGILLVASTACALMNGSIATILQAAVFLLVAIGPAVRWLRRRAGREAILKEAHAALSSHELGSADTSSPFRSSPSAIAGRDPDWRFVPAQREVYSTDALANARSSTHGGRIDRSE